MSETSAARHILEKYCNRPCLDLGYGGDPIVPWAITIDLERPYTKVGQVPQNLSGDARKLDWFKDGTISTVYSSHLLEDFPPEETLSICEEWLRIVKRDGRLVLLLPDEPVFVAHCAKTGQIYNQNHKNHDLTLEWVKANIAIHLPVYIEFEQSPINIYSFAIVMRKI